MENSFDPSQLVLAIVAGAPQHKVRGKKRLQKFAFLLKSVGLHCSANFKIWDFGPYSSEIAVAAEKLSAFGLLGETEEQVGQLRMFTTVYSVYDVTKVPKLSERHQRLLTKLDLYSNVELEVAATIQFFLKSGLDRPQAICKTKQLKPAKTSPEIIEKSVSLINGLEAIN